MRNVSKVAPEWWDYTTLDDEILNDAAKLTPKDIAELARPGFKVSFYDTIEAFFNAEALEYIKAWIRSTEDDPVGICGPIGPTEQLPLVAQMVNELELDISSGHFWGMDEWYVDGKAVSPQHPLSFAKADMDLCFSRIDRNLRMPDENLHFLNHENLKEYTASFDLYKCAVMQGGQGEVKHWAFNDHPKREGEYKYLPPSPQ
jgi:glucosamine-6-phosphate deaminase